jgi:hypothetical protein
MVGQFYGPNPLHWFPERSKIATGKIGQIPLSGRTGGTGFTGSRCPKRGEYPMDPFIGIRTC